MQIVTAIKFSRKVFQFETVFHKILKDHPYLDMYQEFTHYPLEDIKTNNQNLLTALSKIEEQYTALNNFFSELPHTIKKTTEDVMRERQTEPLVGKNSLFSRLLEATHMMKDAIIPALEIRAEENFQGAWKTMSDYADKNIYSKNDKNIELFMPLLQSLYLNEEDAADNLMVQQRALLASRGISNRTTGFNNHTIDILNLCALYREHGVNSSQYTQYLNQIVNRLDARNCHDTPFIEFYAEGIQSLIDVNNVEIAKALDKKNPGYLKNYQVEENFRTLLVNFDTVNELLEPSNQNLNQYISDSKNLLAEIKANIELTPNEVHSGFYSIKDKKALVEAYTTFMLPTLIALNSGDTVEACNITLDYVTKNSNYLKQLIYFTAKDKVTDLIMTVFILNSQDIGNSPVVEKILNDNYQNDVNPILYEVLVNVFNGNPLQQELNKVANQLDCAFDNFVIEKNIKALHAPTTKPKF